MRCTALVRDLDRWLVFAEPRAIRVARRLDEVGDVLDAVARDAAADRWAVGYLAYEAAPALDPTLPGHAPAPDGPPLAWWAIFDRPDDDTNDAETRLAETASDTIDLDWRPTLAATVYRERVEAVRARIAAGETYQANLTFPMVAELGPDFDPGRDPLALFARLHRAQRAAHATYLDTGDFAIVSATPELFFEQHDDRLLTRPMKGTARRGRFGREDAERRAELRTAKNRAENLMIVDMIRNDLGRVARPGSVRVERLFAEETYPTVHQLVSDVRAETDADPVEVLRALFPCASITGAPKRRTMEILRDLEGGPRGVYTGAVGRIGPGRSARLGVAIRTVTVDRRRRRAVYGVGGGIVWDSDARAEWRECRTKAKVLSVDRPRFELIETLRWRAKSGYFHLDRHLDRLATSARHFDFRLDRDAARQALLERAEEFPDPVRHRVRLALAEDGAIRVDAQPFPCAGRETWTVVLDDRPVDRDDPFLFHKTTRRRVYEEARARHPHADEVILWNRARNLTEGTRTNLVLRFGDRFLTPELESGLLAGVYRGALLERGRLRTASLGVEALAAADEIHLVNALRGWIRVDPDDLR